MKIIALEKECNNQGEEFTKGQIESFGRDAKKVVASNTKAITMAFEAESQLLEHLRIKNDNMLKAIQAIDLNASKFTDEKKEINGRLDIAKKAVDEEQKEFNKLANSHRTMRSTLKNHQSNFDQKRVMKFGTLVCKKEDKYQYLTKLGTSILKLLGEAEGNVDLFCKFDHLKMKMNTKEADSITKKEIEAQQVVISGLQDFFASKAGGPKEFKKVFKYVSLWEWANSFCTVLSFWHEMEESRLRLLDLQWKLKEVEEEVEYVSLCLSDLDSYDVTDMKEQQEMIYQFILRLENDNKFKQIARQLRYTRFEDSYFSLINQYKKMSMEAQKQN